MADSLTEQQAFMVLNDLPNIGPITLNRLLEEFGSDPREILISDRRRLESVRGVGPETSAALLNWRTHFDLPREEERLAKAGATFITTRESGSIERATTCSGSPAWRSWAAGARRSMGSRWRRSSARNWRNWGFAS
jgi:hypothetical protein